MTREWKRSLDVIADLSAYVTQLDAEIFFAVLGVRKSKCSCEASYQGGCNIREATYSKTPHDAPWSGHRHGSLDVGGGR